MQTIVMAFLHSIDDVDQCPSYPLDLITKDRGLGSWITLLEPPPVSARAHSWDTDARNISLLTDQRTRDPPQQLTSSSSVNETSQLKPDNENLSGGYYDALGNRIAEEEYFRQAEYEQKHGVPYARNREAERENSKKPLSVLVHSDGECKEEVVAHITQRGACYRDTSGSSVFVNSLPSDCQVVTFTDAACTQDSFAMIPMLSESGGCFITDAFESVRVDCGPLPE